MKKALHLAKETFFGYFDREISASSAQLSYYFLFSVFPLAMSVGSVIIMTDAGRAMFETAGEILLPDMLQELFSEYYEYVRARDNTIYFSLGIFLSFYFITRYINSAKKKIREIYGDKSEHNVFLEWLLSFLFSVFLAVGFYFTFVLQTVGDNFLKFLSEKFFSFPQGFIRVWELLRFTAIGGYVFLVSLVLYSVIPYKKLLIKSSVPGAIFSSASWMLTSYLFSVYVDNFSKYSVFYGSLAAFMVLMLWLYLINNIILVGALINKNLNL